DAGALSPPDRAAKPTLTAERDGRDLLLRVSVDAEWLRAEERRFPVALDPTITIQSDVEDASFPSDPGYGACQRCCVSA
ncbi:MAG TPA: hypothetical protein VIQ02_12190, partial [Jiangellaceae bacterium]